jgi:hypothetical protein
MTEPSPRRLADGKLAALRFAAHANWRDRPTDVICSRASVPCADLARAVRVLEDRSFAHGCDLHVPREE